MCARDGSFLDSPQDFPSTTTRTAVGVAGVGGLRLALADRLHLARGDPVLLDEVLPRRLRAQQGKGVVVGVAAVGLFVAVPGGEIDAKLQAKFLAGRCHFTDHVAFPSAPRAALDRVIRVVRGPQAKTIMVLGG